MSVPFGPEPLRLVSRGDIVARLAALLLDLGLGERVASKHARDFRGLVGHVPAAEAEAAWRDHRRENQPERFADAADAVLDLIDARSDLLAARVTLFEQVPCPRCRQHPTLRRATAAEVAAVPERHRL